MTRLIPASHARRVPWKNGLGSTLEIATDAAEPDGPWSWRLSIADVPSTAAFSAFPGIDRLIACLQGDGMTLERASARQVVPSRGAALAFAGEEHVVGVPHGADVRDVNLMVRRDTWRAEMSVLRHEPAERRAPLLIVHACAGNARAVDVRQETTAVPVPPGATLVLGEARDAPRDLALDVPDAAAIVLCALWPRAVSSDAG